MLVARMVPAPPTLVEPSAPNTEPPKPSVQPDLPDDLDDEDEALQAMLLASLQAEVQQEVPDCSCAAKAEQESRLSMAVKPPLVSKVPCRSPLALLPSHWCADKSCALHACWPRFHRRHQSPERPPPT